MKPIEINSANDFIEHIRTTTGLDRAAYHIGSGLEEGDSEEICFNNFYEGTVLCDEKEGHIKLNISKEKILLAIREIYYKENPTGIYL